MTSTADEEAARNVAARSGDTPPGQYPYRTPVDATVAGGVARWRKSERARLISQRQALSDEYRREQTLALSNALNHILESLPGAIVSAYWPIQGEPDLRDWMQAVSRRGVRVALPVAAALRQPLSFREWRPGAPLARGLWNIPYPAEGVELVPGIVLAPLVGFDAQCYRLGYGGGFFDRTLAWLSPKPMAVGVGYSDCHIETIYPQPHDVPMDWVVAGDQPPMRRAESPASAGFASIPFGGRPPD